MTKKNIIGPGNHSPRADKGEDYYDYRGTAEESECKALGQQGVSLGRYLNVNEKLGSELFLSPHIVKNYPHCAVIGPTGAGKTAGIIIPWAISKLKQGSSVVVVDVLGNLHQKLGKTAKELDCRFLYWDSCNPDQSHGWNWLRELNLDDENQLEMSITSILGRPPTDERMSFYYDVETVWLRALIPIAKKSYWDLVEPKHLYSLIANKDKLRNVLDKDPELKDEYWDEIIFLVEAAQESSYEYLKIAIGLTQKLSIFKEPSVARISCRSDFTIADIDQEPTLLIIGDRLNNQRAGKLTSLMLSHLFNHVQNRSHGYGNIQIPLNFILDEAPRHKNKINFAEVLSVSRAGNANICLAAQDVTQFGSQEETEEILSNCNTIITIKGVGKASAKFLSETLGKRKVVEHTVAKKTLLDYWKMIDEGHSLWETLFSMLFPGATTSCYTDAPVLGDREIMYPPVGKYPGIVLTTPLSGKPILVELDTTCRTI
jgi:type IV secretory pathway TraG/TraD family ATPase VirD4